MLRKDSKDENPVNSNGQKKPDHITKENPKSSYPPEQKGSQNGSPSVV
jgi:hypothetical protein